MSIWVIWIVRFFKTRFSSHNLYLIALLLVTILISHYFGCLEEYSFTYFICFVAVFVSEINRKRNALKEQQKSTKIDINEKLDVENKEG